MKSGKKLSIKNIIEERFLYSDAIPATVGKFMLATIAAAPVIVIGAVAPNIFSAVRSHNKRRCYTKTQIRTAYNNLKQKKLIEIVREDKGTFRVGLTNKGQKRINDYCFERLEIKKPKKWDKKWRILIFDIPTKPKIYHQAREALRRKIKDLGFYQMQKSVWVYPYDCEDEILFIAELFEIQKYIEIITADRLLHVRKIKGIFKLQ